mgnify:CR=1 FL=1
MEDKPRTDLGQAEDKKDLQRAATEGKCNFTKVYFHSIFGSSGCSLIICVFYLNGYIECMKL